MNVQEYISSGIIESYVLGLASPDERSEFERMCDYYPELIKAREEFELSLEKNLLSNATKPPPGLKTEIFSKLRPEVIGDGNAHAEKQTETALVVPIRGVRYVAVASIVLLIASTLLNYYFFTQYKEYSIKYQQLVLNQTQVASANEILQTKLQDYESILNLIKNPAMAIVKMPGTPKSPSPSSLTTIYWDTRSKDVYLLVNNLPQPESNKQYQLWALVNGKPVDAGVFEFNTDSLSLIKMKTIPKAQAFAITLEKRGGSLTPTMPIYVLGKTS